VSLRSLRSFSPLLLAFAFVVLPAAASTPGPSEILTQQQQLRGQIVAQKGAFKDVPAGEREAIVRKQDRIIALLQGRASIEELNQDERIELFNHLESVKAAVTNAEDNREVCERRPVVGSNRPRMVCMTAKAQREARERAQNTMIRGARCTQGGVCVSN
jgi:hypothetical protein